MFQSWVTWGVFWGVCTCSNSIYTSIPMPLYSYLVHPVRRNLEFIHNDYYFWWEISLRWKQRPEDFCFALIEIVCDVDGAFKFSLSLPAVLLNTFWDNAMLCSWYRKHLFLDTWLVIQVYRNSNGVKKICGWFYIDVTKAFFYFSCTFCLTYTSPTAAHPLVFSRFNFSLYL